MAVHLRMSGRITANPINGTAGKGTGMKAIRAVLISMLVVLSLFSIVTLLLRLYAPQYTADVYLTVSPPNEQLLQAAATPFPKEIIERFKRSQATMAKHQTVLDGAASDPKLQQTR